MRHFSPGPSGGSPCFSRHPARRACTASQTDEMFLSALTQLNWFSVLERREREEGHSVPESWLTSFQSSGKSRRCIAPPRLGETPPCHHLFKIKILPVPKERFELPHCISWLLSRRGLEEEEEYRTPEPSFHSRRKAQAPALQQRNRPKA